MRNIPSEEALSLLATFCKADSTYVPVKDPRSRRWHVRTACGDFEILTTGLKWFDTRAMKGGGGAIDLRITSFSIPFGDDQNSPAFWAEAVTLVAGLRGR